MDTTSKGLFQMMERSTQQKYYSCKPEPKEKHNMWGGGEEGGLLPSQLLHEPVGSSHDNRTRKTTSLHAATKWYNNQFFQAHIHMTNNSIMRARA